mgnify:FL=1
MLPVVIAILIQPYLRIKCSEEMINKVLLNDEEGKVNISVKDYLSALVGKKEASAKFSQFKEQEDIVFKRLDVLNLMKRVFHIEKVMALAFTPTQRVLMNNIVEINEDSRSVITLDKFQGQTSMKVKTALDEIMTKKEKTQLDIELLKVYSGVEEHSRDGELVKLNVEPNGNELNSVEDFDQAHTPVLISKPKISSPSLPLKKVTPI